MTLAVEVKELKSHTIRLHIEAASASNTAVAILLCITPSVLDHLVECGENV